jgi:SAM-dependent methyltransferase
MTDFDPAAMGEGAAPGAIELVGRLAELMAPEIIEVGTLRWDPEFPTHHERWAPHGRWLRVDREDGIDVDVVDDAHTLATFLPQRFDAYVACSVFEHLERPWKAMQAAADMVKPGGLVYVQTHQTFPLHGYPNDFYRFSDQALRVLAEDAGLAVDYAGYMYRCTVVPPPEVTRWNTADDVFAWLNVELLAHKP